MMAIVRLTKDESSEGRSLLISMTTGAYSAWTIGSSSTTDSAVICGSSSLIDSTGTVPSTELFFETTSDIKSPLATSRLLRDSSAALSRNELFSIYKKCSLGRSNRRVEETRRGIRRKDCHGASNTLCYCPEEVQNRISWLLFRCRKKNNCYLELRSIGTLKSKMYPSPNVVVLLLIFADER